MTEQAVVYSVRHQAGEIQRTRERLRQLVEKANGMRAHIEITLLDAPPEIVRVPINDVVPEYLSTAKAAKLLGLSDDTMRLYCAEGRLEARREGRVWRVSRQSLEHYLKKGGGR